MIITKPKLFKFSITVEADSLLDAEVMVDSILAGHYEQEHTLIDALEVCEVEDGNTV